MRHRPDDGGRATRRVIAPVGLTVLVLVLVLVLSVKHPAPPGVTYRAMLSTAIVRPVFPGMFVPLAALVAAGIAVVVALAGVNRTAATSRFAAEQAKATSISVMEATLARQSKYDEAALQQQRDRDRRDQSWRRVQWAVDLTSADAPDDRRRLGHRVLAVLAERPHELPSEDVLLINLVLERDIGVDDSILKLDEPKDAGLSDGVFEVASRPGELSEDGGR